MFLADLDQYNLPQEFRMEGSDWLATFNPKVKRVLDISLVHTLTHKVKGLVAPFVQSPLSQKSPG